jgi:hypothetical protein
MSPSAQKPAVQLACFAPTVQPAPVALVPQSFLCGGGGGGHVLKEKWLLMAVLCQVSFAVSQADNMSATAWQARGFQLFPVHYHCCGSKR